MATTELLARHRQAQQAAVTLGIRDLTAVWQTASTLDPPAATAVAVETMRAVTATYGDAAAAAAADFYDLARADAAVGGRFAARPAAGAPPAQVDALTRWAVDPIWAADPRYGRALERLAGEAGRLIRLAGRDTITESAGADPAASGWRRITAPGACKFCLMLADRGAVYRRETVRFAAHTNCSCVATPAFGGGEEASMRQYTASNRNRTDEERAALRRYLNQNFPDAPG